MTSDTAGDRFGANAHHDDILSQLRTGRISGIATATVTGKFGPKTRAAIDDLSGKASATASPGVDIKAAWFDEYPIGPSDWYAGTGPLRMGRITDLPFRAGDKITVADIERARNKGEPLRFISPKPAEVKFVVGHGGSGVGINNGTAKTDFGTPRATPQVGGTHYGNPATDVYAFSMANGLDPLQFNVVKYVTRFRKKNGLEDLKKAMHTLQRLIAHEESK